MTADSVIVGAGLNVNFPAAALALDQPLTTLADALGRHASREELLIASLRSFECWYGRWLEAPDAVWQAWRAGSSLLGKVVDVSLGGEVYSGVAEDLDRDGLLCLRTTDGRLQRFAAGDASIRLSRLE